MQEVATDDSYSEGPMLPRSDRGQIQTMERTNWYAMAILRTDDDRELQGEYG